MIFLAVIIGVISPTLWAADLLKQDINRSKVIRFLNKLYFIISIVSLIVITIFEKCFSLPLKITSVFYEWPFFVWGSFLLSRCIEIFYAFLRDAYDKVAGRSSRDRKVIWSKFLINSKNILLRHKIFSDLVIDRKLKNSDRLVLALKSYIELIINFSILYLLTIPSFWKENAIPHGILESMYFSGVTITTLGYGDITPKHWYPQFLTVFEVFCGFSLIVVCFAIYICKDNE